MIITGHVLQSHTLMKKFMDVFVAHQISTIIPLFKHALIIKIVRMDIISTQSIIDASGFLYAQIILFLINYFKNVIIIVPVKKVGTTTRLRINVSPAQSRWSMTKKPRGATITEHASIMNTSTKPFISVWSHPHARKEVITTRLFWSVLAVPSALKGRFSSQNSRNVTTTELV